MVKDSSATDVEMKDVSSPASSTGAINGVDKEEVKKDPDLLTLEGLCFVSTLNFFLYYRLFRLSALDSF